jgi:uncharacterized membrane protein
LPYASHNRLGAIKQHRIGRLKFFNKVMERFSFERLRLKIKLRWRAVTLKVTGNVSKLNCSNEGAFSMRCVFLALLFFLAAAAPARAFFDFFGPSVESVTAQGGLITLDVAGLKRGDARHYHFQDGGAKVRFFVARDQQGAIRAALDACEVCHEAGKGYRLERGFMLCLNCGRNFALSRIGVIVGGCNPHPLKFAWDNESVTLAAEELRAGAKYFPENGR